MVSGRARLPPSFWRKRVSSAILQLEAVTEPRRLHVSSRRVVGGANQK